MQENHVIRPISPADYDQLRDLYKYSLSRNTAGFVQNLDFHGDIAERAAQYQNSNGAMLGIFQDNTLIGFGGLKQSSSMRVELCNLHLHPHQHGKGLGKRMAQILIQDAEELGYDTIELHVTATQDAAIGLYKKLGFSETKRQVYDVEGNAYDTIFMELRIN